MTTAEEPPHTQEILDLLDGRLPADQAAELRERLRGGGEESRRALDWASDFLASAQDLPLPEPPPLLRQRLRRLFSVRTPMRATPVAADLITDTRLTGLMAGTRSGAADEQSHRYQLLFRQGDDTDVLLDIESDLADRIHIRGQVLVSPGVRQVFEAIATWPGGSQRALDGDDLGGFVLRNLPTTTRELLVTNDDLAIQLRLPDSS